MTGFYILDAGMIETDGPPGAIAIGNALEQLGYKVAYVTDSYGTAVMEATKSEAATAIDFPIADDAESEAYAQQLISERDPSVIIAIERCGFTHDLKYRNMRGRDIYAPDFGESVEFRNGEVPVFWACGVTPQAVAMNAKPPLMITHAPGHMFITDKQDEDLAVI